MENIQRHFFYQLERSIKQYRQFAQKHLKAHGYSITVDQWLVLKTLHDNESITQMELAEIVFKDKASVTRIIEILVKNGYIKKGTNESDRRQHKITITAKGRKLIDEIIPVVVDYRKKALNGLKKEEMQQVEKVLGIIFENCSS